MQVSTIETALGTGSGKQAAKPSQAASDAFAILLQNALTQNPNSAKLKMPGENALADHFSADNLPAIDAQRSPARDDTDDSVAETEASPADDNPVKNVPAERNNNATDDVAENLTALTNATEARISLRHTQANATAVSQQDRLASQGAATSKTPVADGNPATVAAQVGQNIQDAKNIADKPEGGAGANAGRATAQVIEAGQTFISRPNNTLSAAATLSAQAAQEKQTRVPGAQASSTIAESADNAPKSGQLANSEAGRNSGNTRGADNGGNLVLNAAEAKAASGNTGRAGQQAPQNIQTPSNGIANNTAAPQQQAAAPIQPVATQPVPPAATGRQAPVVERAGALPAAEPAPTIGAGPAGLPPPGATARVTAPVQPRPASPPSDLKEQISVQVQKAVEQGIDRIRIQLKPADLGRLEIQLDVAQDGKVAILVNADRPETLEMLRRDARGLQQALQDAGLQTDSGNLSFNLGGGNASFGERLADGNGPNNGQDVQTGNADENNGDATVTNPHRQSSNSTIDVEV